MHVTSRIKIILIASAIIIIVAMTDVETIDLLGFGIMVAWLCKAGFYFIYLKSIDKTIEESNLISFHWNIHNFPTMMWIILPFFFSRSKNEEKEVKIRETGARVSSLVLLTMFVVYLYYIYYHPQK